MKSGSNILLLSFLSLSLLVLSVSSWQNEGKMPRFATSLARAKQTLSQMTIDEKITMVHGTNSSMYSFP